MSEQFETASSPFAAEVQRILKVRGISWRRLAELAGYHPSWLSKVRHGAPPSTHLVRRCDEILKAGGRLILLAGLREGPRPAQLPAVSARFVGRNNDLSQLQEAFRRELREPAARIVVVDGPPGVGKTSVALRCAHDLRALEGGLYPDGELFVDLQGYSPDQRPVSPETVLEEFLMALGVRASELPATTEQRASLYRSIMASRRILVVLDNAKSSAQVEPLLPGSSTCGVLVTSREKLHGLAVRFGGERVRLGPMPVAEAIEVLRAELGGSTAWADTESLAELADHCGRLPLALRIVAERVFVHPQRPLAELIRELAVERQRLDGLELHDSLAVRTVFEWSYRNLSEDEARIFRLASLHRGAHFSAEAVVALSGMPPAVRLLEKLAAVNLLEGTAEGRYHFHDLLWVYAAERAAEVDSEADRNTTVRSLTDWYLHSAAAAGRALAPFRLNPLVLAPARGVRPLTFGDEDSALRWFDAEADNFVAVIRSASDHQFHEVSWKLGIVLFDYLRLLRRPGRLWLETTTEALGAARACGDRYAEGWVETSLAEGYRWLGRYERSQAHFHHALAARREVGDRQGEGWTLAGLGFLAIDRGLIDQAQGYAEEALSIFNEFDDRHGKASALFTLADVHLNRRLFDAALHTLLESQRTFEIIENHDGQALASTKIADVHLARGEVEEALSSLEHSLRERRIAGSRWGEADGQARVARVLQRLGRLSQAQEALDAAIVLYEELDDPRADRLRGCRREDPLPPMGDLLDPPGW